MRTQLGLCLALGACAPTAPSTPEFPGDWRDRVFYQIVTDRFANGDPANDEIDGIGPIAGELSRWQGGDWAGITDQLDYIERLGATAIWISPITRGVARMDVGDGYHGYWAADFTELEPHFGTEEDLRTLVREAHARDIAVLVDIVPNHTGRVFSYDLDGDGAEGPAEALPAYRATPYDAPLLFTEAPQVWVPGTDGRERSVLGPEHFHRRGVGDLRVSEERRFGDFPDGLRDLTTENDALADALAETYGRWAVLLELDGFRIDAVPHAEVPFWQRFCGSVRARVRAGGRREFLLLGEVFERTPGALASWIAPGTIDAAFDLPLLFGVVGDVILGGAPPSEATDLLDEAAALYPPAPQPGGVPLPPWALRVVPESSHDLPRLRAVIDDAFAVDQALVLVFTAGGIPLVYYGTEAELTGIGGHGAREPLWPSGFRTDTPTFELIALLSALRSRSLALRRGATEVVYSSTTGGRDLTTSEPDAGLFAFERTHGHDGVLVVFGTHPTRSAQATLRTGFLPGTMLVDRLGGERRVVVGEAGAVVVDIAPRTTWILGP